MVLDTNVLSELMRKQPEPIVVSFFKGCTNPLVSAIVFHELTFGVNRMDDSVRKVALLARIEDFRRQFRDSVIAVDAGIAELSGQLRAAAGRIGRILTPMDSMIAASALARGATLATRNLKDFVPLGIATVDPWRH